MLNLAENNDFYSRVLHKQGVFVVCADVDSNSVEANYAQARQHNELGMLPLLVDLTNPGRALGWEIKKERQFINGCDVMLLWCWP